MSVHSLWFDVCLMVSTEAEEFVSRLTFAASLRPLVKRLRDKSQTFLRLWQHIQTNQKKVCTPDSYIV